MIYLFYGDEPFLVREELVRLRAGLGDPEMLGLNTTVLDGARVVLPELRAACDTVPFLAEARLVLVEGLLGRFEPPRNTAAARRPRARRENLGDWARLGEYLPRVPATTHLVFTDGSLTARNPLLAQVGPLAQTVQGRKLRGASLEEWVRRRALLSGAEITPGAVRLLALVGGDDLWLLDSELKKLAVYAGDRPIEEEDVGELVALARVGDIFALLDAVVARNLRDAARCLHRLLDSGDTPGHILAMLGREFRIILIAQALSARGLKNEELTQRLGIFNPWALQKTVTRAKRFGVAPAREALVRVLEADVLIKSGLEDSDVALDLLVADLCR